MAEVRQDTTPGALRVPGPQFGVTCARLGANGPDPDPNPQTEVSNVGSPRWARCPEQGRLHLLHPTDVIATASQGQARAVCGRPIPAEGLTLTSGTSTALCMACILGAISPMSARSPEGGSP